MSRRAAILCAAWVTAFAAPLVARGADDPLLFLARDPTDLRVLLPFAPTGTNPREDALTASEGETVTFGPFATEPLFVGRVLGTGPVSFSIFLATGASGMPGCADVVTTLATMPAAGTPMTLATSELTTTLVPKAVLIDPIAGLASMDAGLDARTLAPGDRLTLTIAVTNRCEDGGHSVRLLYGAAARKSLVAFADTCPDLDDPDQLDTDDDGVGDACDVCPMIPNADQADGDGDGVGDACDGCPDVVDPDQSDGDGDGVADACDDCPDVADPDQSDADGDGIASACDACPAVPGEDGLAAGCPCMDAACDDADACTVDTCEDGTGCSNAPLVGLALVDCRVLGLREVVVAVADIHPKLRPIYRAMKQAGRALLRVERAQRTNARSYPRRVDELRERLELLVERAAAAARAERLSPVLYERLSILAAEAIDAIPDA